MQFTGKLNEAEVQEALRLTRPKGYTRRLVLLNFRLIIYAIVALAVVWASVVQHARIPPQLLAIRIVVLVIVGGYSVVRYRRTKRETVESLDASMPDFITLSSEGVRHAGPNGAEGFQPWSSYTEFREGAHVVVLRRKEKALFTVIPITILSEGERASLRGLLGNAWGSSVR